MDFYKITVAIDVFKMSQLSKININNQKTIQNLSISIYILM